MTSKYIDKSTNRNSVELNKSKNIQEDVDTLEKEYKLRSSLFREGAADNSVKYDNIEDLKEIK